MGEVPKHVGTLGSGRVSFRLGGAAVAVRDLGGPMRPIW